MYITYILLYQYLVHPQAVATELEETPLLGLQITVALQYIHSLGTTDPNLRQHDNATEVDVEELKRPAHSPDLNPTEHLQDESKSKMYLGTPCQTSV